MHRGNYVKRWTMLRKEEYSSVPSSVKHRLGALHKVHHVIPTDTLSVSIPILQMIKIAFVEHLVCFKLNAF